MSDATTPTTEPKTQPSLFTRLAAVEAELQSMRNAFTGLKADHQALREDRDEWRWRVERLLADREQGVLNRCFGRTEKALDFAVAWLRPLPPTRLRVLFRFFRFVFDKPKNDVAVAFAGPSHGPHAVHDGRLDLNEALVPVALHGPPR
jgi:hypothetical protein